MTDDETIAASKALVNWFQSQDIMPADAASVMTTTLAASLVSKTRDISSLQDAVNATRDMLVLDIALQLKKLA